MTEETVLDYNYVDALNWMSFFKIRQDQENKANGQLA